MQSLDPSLRSSLTVVIGTGGTIAGTAADVQNEMAYVSGQLGIADLVAALPALVKLPLETLQLAQIDSKDMSFALWLALTTAVDHHLARSEVSGIVITHGTDTLEETAYFLQRMLAPRKPVVLVGSMRPATSAHADGPQNLLDAITVARHAGASGVVIVMAGEVHSALDARKLHTTRIDAFSSGDAGVLGLIDQGAMGQGSLTMHRPWPSGTAFGLRRLPTDITAWPQVEIITSHVGAGSAMVDALRQTGVQGIVAACTGNGTLHEALEAALIEAQFAGVCVLRSSRCLNGEVIDASTPSLPSAGALTPVQARIELMLQLMPHSSSHASTRSTQF